MYHSRTAALESDSYAIPPKLKRLFYRAGDNGRAVWAPSRYKIAHGGRGSGKSWGFVRTSLALSSKHKLRVLCVREVQNSIQESIHRLLCDQIEHMRLSPYFDIQKQGLYGNNGSDYIFAGIRTDPAKIKSTEGVDICLVEEAEKVSEESWRALIPTIRKPGSEIWVCFNPREEFDPTYKRFVLNTPSNSRITQINWSDNPWFPAVLEQERNHALDLIRNATDDKLREQAQADYDHVWEGACRTISESQILKGKTVITEFHPNPSWDGPYFGADWGFATDPTALVKLWIYDNVLYVEHEAWGVGIEIDHTPELFDTISGARTHTIRADSARPETISYMRRRGFDIRGAAKGQGSVEDGIAFLRGFRSIVIHPRCTHFAEEARLYSYKVDRLSGDILPIPIDSFNHCIDAARYALEPIMKRTQQGYAGARPTCPVPRIG